MSQEEDKIRKVYISSCVATLLSYNKIHEKDLQENLSCKTGQHEKEQKIFVSRICKSKRIIKIRRYIDKLYK